MRNRKQTGQIIVINSRWYVRYYQRQTVNGALERRRVTHLLGSVATRGKTPPADIVTEAEKHMNTINHCTIPVEQIVGLGEFIEGTYLPSVKTSAKPSTYRGYTNVWESHLKPLVTRQRINLKDFKTSHVQRWLDAIGQGSLSRNSLKRIKSMISGVFAEAKRLGFYNGENPARDTRVNPHAAAAKATFAYSLEQIETILSHLPEPAATIFAIAAYTGLRRGEIEGLEWTDYYDGELLVRRSRWNGQTVAPKTEMSGSAVPVIRPLAERLEIHRLRNGDAKKGWMFSTGNGNPTSMNNTLNRQILPSLNICIHCGLSEGKPHLKAKDCPGYERDPRIPEWHGFHAARRGLGSNLYRLGVHDKVIQKILRHSNVSTTTTYYIKSTATDVAEAMQQFEQNIAQQSEGQTLRDSDRTVKTDSAAMAGFVN